MAKVFDPIDSLDRPTATIWIPVTAMALLNIEYDKLDSETNAAILRIVQNLEEFSRYVRGTAPQITGILEKGQDALKEGKAVLEAIKNNPLLSGGVTQEREQPTTIKSFRDEAF